MILQAYDFLELHRRHGCLLQMGGSDQWGNILNGIDLTRRVEGAEVFGLTTPLLTTSDGRKMGKSAAGAVWLNAEALSPYDFWQFWRNTTDADVGRFLKLYTELPVAECDRLGALGGVRDQRREDRPRQRGHHASATAPTPPAPPRRRPAPSSSEGGAGEALEVLTVRRGSHRRRRQQRASARLHRHRAVRQGGQAPDRRARPALRQRARPRPERPRGDRRTSSRSPSARSATTSCGCRTRATSEPDGFVRG